MLVEVYKDIETSILRGYMVVQLAYMILGLRDTGVYTLIWAMRCIK